MTKKKHPKDRGERLRLREKKDKERGDQGVAKAVRRKKKETDNEVSFEIDNK